MNIKTEISKIHYTKENTGALFSLLCFGSRFYSLASGLKNYLYDNKILTPQKVDAFVVSVGNLTTGGVGKTPVVAELVKRYMSKGKKVAIVSRGYGGKLKGVNVISDGNELYFDSQTAGDEPYWLGTNTKAVVITSPVRYEGAKLAVDKYGVDVVILDDGFQHRKLHRDLDVVLIDSEKRFGNEKQLPAGPLRESIDGLRRADKIVVVSKNVTHYGASEYAEALIEKYKKPVAICKAMPDVVYNIFDESDILENGQQVIAFSGIGQPEQFYKFLKPFDVIKTVDFDDHHDYTQKDMDNLQLYKLPLVTTEKDAVKCKSLKFTQKIYALKLKMTIEDVKW